MKLANGSSVKVDSPAKLPPPNEIDEILEPVLDLTIVAPSRHVGVIMDLMHSRRSEFKRMEYIQGQGALRNGAQEQGDQSRVMMDYTMPLVELLADFYNQLKSRTQGYASLDYSFSGYQRAPLVKVDVLVNHVPVEALSMILHRDQAVAQGRRVVDKLRTTIPSSYSRCRYRRPSVAGSSPGKRCGQCAKTYSPSATAATSPGSANCWSARKKERSA